MDVVLSNLTRVDGEVHVESHLGKGTIITLTLPKKDSLLIDGLVLRIGGDYFMLPYKYVKGFLPWQETQTNLMLGRGRIALLDGGTLPVANAGLLTDAAVSAPKEAILLEDRKGRQCALPVDEVVGRKRVLMQDIKRDDVFPDLFTGTIILGNGAVAFVVDADSFVGRNVG
jgi:two-component system chemotaxis sensor kinase CheA